MIEDFKDYVKTDEGLDQITRVVLSYISAVDDPVAWITAEKTEFVEPGIHAAMIKHLPPKFEENPKIVEKIKMLIQVFRAELRMDYEDALEYLGESPTCECGTWRYVGWRGGFVLKCGECGSEEEVPLDGRTAGAFGSLE